MKKLIPLAIVVFSLVLPAQTLAHETTNQTHNKRHLAGQARAYFNAQNANDWDKACRMLSKRALNLQGGLAGCKANFATNGFAVTRMDIDRVTVTKSGYRGTVFTHLFGDRSQRWNLTFVRERGTYKLDHDRS
jgi:hypothetical protein